MIHIWYTYDTHMVCRRYTDDTQIMHMCDNYDPPMLDRLFTDDRNMVHIWHTDGTHALHMIHR